MASIGAMSVKSKDSEGAGMVQSTEGVVEILLP